MGTIDSKTIFRDQIHRLLNEDVPSVDTQFWQLLFTLDVNTEDITLLVPLADIRNLNQERKENLLVLIKCSMKLLQDTARAWGRSSHTVVQGASNAVRILSRIIPVTLEAVDDEEWLEFWWGEESNAFQLLDSTLSLMFTPGYGLVSGRNQRKIEKPNEVSVGLLWYGGLVSQSLKWTSTSKVNERRIDILRLLLSCLGQDLFYSQGELTEFKSPWQWTLTSLALKHSNQFFYSLMNSLFAYDSVGKWNIPYSAYVGIKEEETITKLALQALSVLLVFRPPSLELVSAGGFIDQVKVSQLILQATHAEECLQRNEFVFRLSVLEDEGLELICRGIARKLQVLLIVENTYFPSSQRQLNCANEVVFFMWSCMQTIPDFLETLVSVSSPPQILVPLLILLYKEETQEVYVGMKLLCSHIICELSALRAFALQIQAKCNDSVPYSLPLFYGSYYDLLILSTSIHILKITDYTGNRCHMNMLLSLRNTAPFTKAICNESAHYLLLMVKKLSHPTWILRNQSNYTFLWHTMELLSFIILYQWEASSSVVLQLLKQSHVFSAIQQFKINTGIQEEKQPDSGEEEEKIVNSSVLHSHVSASSDDDIAAPEQKGTVIEWTPTQDWVNEWKTTLPLTPILIAIRETFQMFSEHMKDNKTAEDEKILVLIRNSTLVGLLPLPGRFIVKHPEFSEEEKNWKISCMWSLYTTSHIPPIFEHSTIKLFRHPDN